MIRFDEARNLFVLRTFRDICLSLKERIATLQLYNQYVSERLVEQIARNQAAIGQCKAALANR